MKKTLFFTFLTLSLLLSCSSDSDSDNNNNNNSGETPCTPIACLNGGVSRPDCGCDCPIGFTGPNCSTQITPSKILITKIKVKNFPNKKPDGVTTWDDFLFTSFNSPDIFPFLTVGSTSLFQGDDIQDAISNGNGTDNFTWTPSTPIEIISINSQYTLNLYDEDAGEPGYEFMGGFNFPLYNSTGGFPTTLNISNATSPYKFELTVSYVW
jgi:hypothetical protein